MTRDSVLVVMHDPTLDRTMRGAPDDCKGRVIDKTLAQIKRCDAGLWFNERFPQLAKPEFAGQRVLALEELFQRYGDSTNYYIETKNPEDAPGMERRMIALIRAYKLGPSTAPRGRVVIQSFSEPSLRLVHELAPELPLVQLVERRPEGNLDATFARIAGYAEGLGPDKRLVDAEWMKAAHAHCLAVHPYTVNETEEMRRLLALGVDGMFTNFADRLRALVQGPRIRMTRYCASSS
jgi:glycerophosphoryl diester phosphodiesterase